MLAAGVVAMLLGIVSGPAFIAFLRRNEFGQNIREDGPEGHHAKAGTPTMGGIIIFTAIAVPFLLLTDWDWRAVGVFGAAEAPEQRLGLQARAAAVDAGTLADVFGEFLANRG